MPATTPPSSASGTSDTRAPSSILELAASITSTGFSEGGSTTPRIGGRGVLDWQRNGVAVREPGYATHLLTDEAVRLIEGRDSSRPLFLCVTFNAPHTPLSIPPEVEFEELGIAREFEEMKSVDAPIVYRTMVEALDRSIGRILDSVDREGLREDTIVLFASDNGTPLQYGGSNSPLRGEKYTTFEGGIRTPAILRWPGHVPAGELSETVVSHVDLFPTLAAAAGIPLGRTKELDGVDRWAALRPGGGEPREPVAVGAREGRGDEVGDPG